MKWRTYVWVAMTVMLGGKAAGQNPATTVRDSVPVVQTIPIRPDSVGNGQLLDTVALTPKQNARIRKIVPRKATIRSALVPGLGQIYNGHWWKVPIIYAGFGTLAYFANRYSEDYRFFRKYGILAFNSTDKQIEVPGYSGKIGVDRLERAARSSARYRDYNFLGMALLWGVNVIEANVTAHLKTFDISEDLTLNVKPHLLMPVIGTVPVPGVRLAFTFK
ncbi:DUF5683 domain-containing protein [Larkinella sp. VNQ87]|uniref:DUF5683 domain-containing protein n=1 Tax=Larkinella sp. VNQ87 TaxID=3400921 RepID=UPI003C0AE653